MSVDREADRGDYLAELVDDGYLVRQTGPFAEHPNEGRYEYRLTPKAVANPSMLQQLYDSKF